MVPLQNAYESEPNQFSLDLGLALLELGKDRATRKRGLDLLTAAAEALDNSLAYEVLALLHVSGVNVTQDVGQAHREMAAAARLGSDGFPGVRATAWGGDWEFWPAFIQRIQNRLEANYQSGDPASAAFLARMANVGLAVGIDGHLALEIARFGAQRGEGLAMRSLYHFYSQGVGTEKDTSKAMDWVRRGAEAGDLFCQMFYGNALIDGESRPRDLAQGVQWLTRAANGGNRWAIGDMAHLHAEGWQGLPVSPEKALPWWRQLADLGDPEALGWLQYHGHT
jgi:TPR repeat protein